MLKKTLLQRILSKKSLAHAASISSRCISNAGPGKYSQSYVCGPGHKPLIGPNISYQLSIYCQYMTLGHTIGDLIDIGAAKWGNDREALVSVHQVHCLLCTNQNVCFIEYKERFSGHQGGC